MRARQLVHAVLSGSLIWVAGCSLPALDSLFLQSPGPPRKSPGDLGLAFEDVRIVSANGRSLAGWFTPAVDGPAAATFLVHTGMRGNLDTYLPVVPWAARNGFNILVYDWQGFGASEGQPGFVNFEPDTYAAVGYLLSRPDSNGRIIQLGASLGAVCAMAATKAYPDETVGLVLYGACFPDDMASTWLETQISPLLTPIGRIGDAFWTAFLPDFFDMHQYLGSIRVPILAITPEDDTIVPPVAQQRLYATLPEPKQRYLTYGGHVHSPASDMQLEPVVVEWAKAVVAAQGL